jgi:hypothetical protein
MYQHSLALSGFFIRGAISVGELFVSDELVFGDGLLQAHEAETQLARDPRIVLAKSALTSIEKHMCYYSSVRSSPHNYHLLADSDKQVFVNYLMVPLDGSPGNEHHEHGLKKHRDHIKENLERFQDRPRIWNKYSWAANYHNFVCDWIYPNRKSVRIPPDVLQAHPRRLHSIYKKKGSDLIDRSSHRVVQVGKEVHAEAVKSLLKKETN